MSMSIEAQAGEIAGAVLLTSNPLWAQRIAETMLKKVSCYSRVRNMLGFTGEYAGTRVSVQGIGIGVASAAIYCSELAQSYAVKKMVCIDEGVGVSPKAGLSRLVLAQTAHTASSMNRLLFDGRTFAGSADWALLNRAYDLAMAEGLPVEAGAVLTLETAEDHRMVSAFAERGALCTDFGTSALYLCAGRFGVKALSMLCVTQTADPVDALPEERREEALSRVAHLALPLLCDQ